jgi:hypothetical protein
MDADRLIRYTIHGLFFIFSLIFHYWAITGEIPCFILNLVSKDSSAILSFLVALASSPGLGLVTATIGNRILSFLFGPRLIFRIPTKEGERNWYFNALWINLPNLRQEVLELESKLSYYINAGWQVKLLWYVWRRSLKKIHLLFNLVLRMKSPPDLSKFVLRRWNIFWMHINIIFAILLGFILALILLKYTDKDLSASFKLFCQTYYYLEIPILVYFGLAIWHLHEARKEAIDIEYKWLLSTSSLSSSTKRRKITKNRGRKR